LENHAVAEDEKSRKQQSFPSKGKKRKSLKARPERAGTSQAEILGKMRHQNLKKRLNYSLIIVFYIIYWVSVIWKIQKPVKGWVELRKAVLLDQTNKRAATDFMRIWSFFDGKGLLNVGTPEAEILKVLGKPDRQRDLNGESQLVYGFMWINFRDGRLFALVDTRGLKAEFTKAVSTLEFQLDPWWKEAIGS